MRTGRRSLKVGVLLERFSYKRLGLPDVHSEWSDCLSYAILIELASFGKVQCNASIDVCSSNVVEFF